MITDCNFITSRLTIGRLGNKLFDYASLYGLAKINRKKPIQSTYDNKQHLNIFKNLSIPYANYSLVTFINYLQNGCCRFNEHFTKMPCDRNVTVSGFKHSYKYFDKFKEELKNEFTFNETINKDCDAILQKALLQINLNFGNCFVVGAHMRRGDFVSAQKTGYVPAEPG